MAVIVNITIIIIVIQLTNLQLNLLFLLYIILIKRALTVILIISHIIFEITLKLALTNIFCSILNLIVRIIITAAIIWFENILKRRRKTQIIYIITFN